METKKHPSKELNNKRFIFLQVGLVCSLALSIAIISWNTPNVPPAQLNYIPNNNYNDNNDLPPVTTPDDKPIGINTISVSVNSPYINIKPNNTPLAAPTIDFDPTGITGYDPGRTYGPGGATGGRGHEPIIPDDVPVVFAEQFPMFGGRDGQVAFSEWCQDNLKYPVAAAENGAYGKVYISFIIETNGKLTNPEVARSSGNKYLDKAALDIVAKAPARWTAAKNNGRSVRFQYIVPVEFQLEH